MKKTIKIILAIILVLTVILGIKIIMTKDKKNYTPEQIRKKMLSAYNYTNYTYEYISDGKKTTKKVKGNIIVTENDETYSWIDGEAMSLVTIDKQKKTYLIKSVNSSTKDLLYKKDFLDIKSLLDIYKDELYYLGNEKYNGKNCLRIQAGNKGTEYLIDEETGFVLRYEAKDGTVAEFNLELNNVTADDVKLPDLAQ